MRQDSRAVVRLGSERERSEVRGWISRQEVSTEYIGAVAGTEAGAVIGLFIGGPVGAGIGGIIGGIAGGFGGAFGGEKFMDWLGEP
jgi:hypothetical protein